MKRIIISFISVLFITFSSCDYLNIVPDNAISLDYFYTTKENAVSGLAKAYGYLSNIGHRDESIWLMSDEYLGRTDWWGNSDRYRGERIIRGFQNEQNPILGDWSGTNGGIRLYEAIRQCNIFLENIHNVRDMTREEISEWSAQVKFLKAYYHFQLMQKYGPIIIRDQSISLEAPKDELFADRQKVDICFNTVIKLIDEAIPFLKEECITAEAGMVDQIAAKAMKARILLYRASPFYNGNSEYYAKFVDHDGQPFFPMTYSKEKWKDVIDACTDAIQTAKRNNKGLYKYEGNPYRYDIERFEQNPEQMKLLYSLRMKIVDPWNKEVLWGYSNIPQDNNALIPYRCQIRYWPQLYMESLVGDYRSGFSSSDLGATYAMLERYYTKNGLPPNEDLSFDMFSKHNIITTPEGDSPDYEQYIGILQPNARTIQLYLDREMRFYVDLGLTGGYWRGHQWIMPTKFLKDTYGGKESNQNMTIPGSTTTVGRGDVNNECLSTAIGIQKFIHPESVAGAWQRQRRYPFPIIRYADLLLIKAEALNEYYEGPDPNGEVYDLINEVRSRAGVPDVQVSYGAVLGVAKQIGKHTNQSGLRDIILYERSVELAFEGSRFWDMVRHKRAPKEFSQPVFGWDIDATMEEDFFQLQLKQGRRFTITDCLWPIDIAELNRQGTLIQNPGWK